SGTMKDDDFPDESDSFCDAEAFAGSLHHLATAQIDALLRHRAAHAPALDDATLIPLLEAVLKPFEEFLSDRQIEEVWGYLYWMYHESRKSVRKKWGRDPCIQGSRPQFFRGTPAFKGPVPISSDVPISSERPYWLGVAAVLLAGGDAPAQQPK